MRLKFARRGLIVAVAGVGILSGASWLRAQKASLLGFPTWADYILQDQMAKTPQAAKDFMLQLVSEPGQRDDIEARCLGSECNSLRQDLPQRRRAKIACMMPQWLEDRIPILSTESESYPTAQARSRT